MATYRLTRLRQLGDQEVDIIRMVRGITKYAVLIEDPNTMHITLNERGDSPQANVQDHVGWTFQSTFSPHRSIQIHFRTMM